MRKILFLLLICCLIFTGCTNNTIEKEESENPQIASLSSTEQKDQPEDLDIDFTIAKSTLISPDISGDIEFFKPIKINENNFVALLEVTQGDKYSFFVKGYNKDLEEIFSTKIQPTQEYNTLPYDIVNIGENIYVLETITKSSKINNTVSIRKFDLKGNEIWQKENENYDRLHGQLICAYGKVYSFSNEIICTLDDEFEKTTKIQYPVIIKRDVAHEFNLDFSKLKTEQLDAGPDFVLLGMRTDDYVGYIAKVNLSGNLEWAKQIDVCKAMGVFDDEIVLACKGNGSNSSSILRMNLEGEIIGKVENVNYDIAKFAVVQKVGNCYAFQTISETQGFLYDLVIYDKDNSEIKNDLINEKYDNITIFGDKKSLTMFTEKYEEKDLILSISEIKVHKVTF